MQRLSTGRSSTPRVSKDRIVVLFGPTAVGKTALTEELFSTGYEIINSDSVQVYRHLDIASAKPTKELMSLIPHHLVDILEPYEQFTVGDYVKSAEALIPEIISRGRVPLLTGGTAFYFKQFLYGSALTPESDPAVRSQVASLINEKGKHWAHSYLSVIDPVSASRINVNDVYRTSRAIEVYVQSGRPLSSFALANKLREDYDIRIIALYRDKSILDKRIEERVDQMFRMGLVKEIDALKAMGAQPSWPGLCSIGYKEFFDESLTSLDEIRNRIIIASRQYAKRQMTFFRSFKDALWFSPEDVEGIRKAIN